jgi:hypothetical protein
MNTISIRDGRVVPYEQYEQARRLLVDALFIGVRNDVGSKNSPFPRSGELVRG